MNKVVLVGGIVGVAAVAYGAVNMVGASSQIDKVVENLDTQVPAPFAVNVVEDSDSFTFRQLDLALTIDQAPFDEMGVELLINNNIAKRPWGTAIESSVSLPESILDGVEGEDLEFLRSQFVENAFMSGTTNVSLAGGVSSEWTSTDFSYTSAEDGVELSFTPLAFNAEGSFGGSMKADGSWNGMSVRDVENEEMSMSVLPMTFTVDGEYVDGLLIGKQVVSIDGFNFKQNDGWTDMEAIVGKAVLESDSSVDGDLLTGEMKFALENVAITEDGEETLVDDIVFAAAVSGVKAADIKALNDAAGDMSDAMGMPSAEAAEAMNSLLQGGFVLSFPEISANYKGSKFAANASLTIPANDMVDINNPFSLMGLVTEISAEANLELDTAFADMPELAEPMMGLMMTGSLVEAGDKYTMSFTMNNGEALLNGNPLPLPF